ncbi:MULTISPECIES: hypothetical protein [Metallosphaera]|uniref:hypothetical protein n=1 Tax=Metallosphaera TaxID=41980 RepID=UPI001873C173|nr:MULTISPECIES: hypothetical protein [Metallosphaera]MCH1771454.1 hypothetical protein [Metallosphaera sedula]MCP6729095.1 hypothetical protein [Metallosphaera sedula]
MKFPCGWTKDPRSLNPRSTSFKPFLDSLHLASEKLANSTSSPWTKRPVETSRKSFNPK